MDDEPALAQAKEDVQRRRRNTWLIVFGVLLFFAGGTMAANNPGGGFGGLLFGILGVGLVVAGIVTRPRL